MPTHRCAAGSGDCITLIGSRNISQSSITDGVIDERGQKGTGYTGPKIETQTLGESDKLTCFYHDYPGVFSTLQSLTESLKVIDSAIK